MAPTVASYVEAIEKLMADNPGKIWQTTKLASEVCQLLTGGQTGLNRVRHIIATLATAGKLQGYGFKNDRVGAKKPTEAGSAAETAAIAKERENARTALEAYRNASELVEAMKLKVAAAEKAMQESRTILEVHVTRNDSKKVEKVTGVFHAKFPRLVSLAKARENIFLYGPTGCGKTFIVEQLSTVMGMEFSFVSCTTGMSEGVLGGKLLPVGKAGTFEYVISEFVNRYENGGIFLLDEMDAADPNVLLFINAALANGKCYVPNRPAKPYAKRHPDFVCVAAANTVGTGSDRLYSGRNKLDGATMDRFGIGKVHLDYDPTVEAKLCPDDVLRSRLSHYRDGINANRLERAMSTRFMQKAYKMKTHFEWTDAMVDEAFFEGWREDEVTKVKNYVRY